MKSSFSSRPSSLDAPLVSWHRAALVSLLDATQTAVHPSSGLSSAMNSARSHARARLRIDARGPLCKRSRASGLGSGPLLAAGILGLTFTGCEDWPHFDYAPSPERVVQEGGEDVAILDLGMLEGSVAGEGVISEGHFLPDGTSVFGDAIDGWYTEDMDWYQFQVRDPISIQISLEWTGEGDLDLLLAQADSSGNLNTIAQSNQAVGAAPAGIEPILLDPFVSYAVAVAPRDAEASPLAYRVLLTPESE